MIKTLLLLVFGWFVVAAVLLVLAVVAAFSPIAGVTGSTMLMVFLGWLLLGIVVAVGLGVALKFVIKRVVDTFKNMSVPGEQHFVIHLLPADQLAVGVMNNDARAAGFIRQLQADGFIEGNYYRADELTNITIFGCRHPELDIYAAVYLMPGLPAWVDLANDFEDGQEITVTNASVPPTLDHRPGAIRVDDANADVPGLLALYEKHMPQTPPVPTRTGEFPQAFERVWWRQMFWRKQKGFASAEEVRRISKTPMPGDPPGGKPEVSEEDIQTARAIENESWRQAWEQVPTKLGRHYLKSTGMTDEDEDWYEKQAGLVIAFEGQTFEEFQAHLNQKLVELADTLEEAQAEDEADPDRTQTFKPIGFKPRVDGYKLQAAAEGTKDGLAAGQAVSRKHPDWFKAVHTSSHPMTFAVYELPR